MLQSPGQGGVQLSLQPACVSRVDPARIGIATSTYYTGTDTGNGLGPVIGGWLSDAYGYATMFGLIAGLLVAGLFCFLLYQKKTRKVTKAQHA